MGHHLLLSGGAGSGKTFSLVEVLQSISSLVPSAHIACITYTNAAAIEIKNRASVKNLRVSTIHDFLWDSIAQFQKELKVTLLELINEPDNELQEFIDNNEYLYWRVSDIAFVEVQNLYKYIEGHMPFSTQHKIKGLEFKNVLIVLHNGGWNNYNFEYLFNRNVGAMLTPAQKRSYPNILRRTQKLFYVCCTRAKDNLVVYYPSPSDEVLEGAVSLFGRDNCIDLDAE